MYKIRETALFTLKTFRHHLSLVYPCNQYNFLNFCNFLFLYTHCKKQFNAKS